MWLHTCYTDIKKPIWANLEPLLTWTQGRSVCPLEQNENCMIMWLFSESSYIQHTHTKKTLFLPQCEKLQNIWLCSEEHTPTVRLRLMVMCVSNIKYGSWRAYVLPQWGWLMLLLSFVASIFCFTIFSVILVCRSSHLLITLILIYVHGTSQPAITRQ